MWEVGKKVLKCGTKEKKRCGRREKASNKIWEEEDKAKKNLEGVNYSPPLLFF